jgi:hypothetical protein
LAEGSLKTTLHVERTSSGDVQNRQVYVTLDGAPLATLMYGKSAEKVIEPGTHTLRADNTWKKKTVEFTVTEGEHAAFQIVSKPGWGYNLLVGFFGAAPIDVAIEPIAGAEPQ